MPLFTGLKLGFGKDSAGGAITNLSFTIKKYDTSNSLQSTTPYLNVAPGTTYTYADAGYYTLELEPDSLDIQFQMWAWGGAGGTGVAPGPAAGGAGGGVRGTSTFSGGDTITFLVGGGGANMATTNQIASSFPDGGNSLTPYSQGPGGGRSSIYDGALPYANRDATPNTFLLIGGGGGGGASYCTSGTLGAQGGYPAGTRGGGYYTLDGQVDGYGGDQSSGGAGGAAGRDPGGSTAGSKYQGGPTAGGSAGGGGYYGGGGAGGYYAMGGGGSGYIDPSLANTASFTASPGDHRVAVDDPANPGIKPTPAGTSGGAVFSAPNGGEDGVVIFKVLNV